MRLTISNAHSALASHNEPFKVLFQHGTLAVEFYEPDTVDQQTPHSRDEIYVIATGTGTFVLQGNEQPVEIGEVLFAPAGTEHRFIDFSDDFSTWVFFYGPEGGEAKRD